VEVVNDGFADAVGAPGNKHRAIFEFWIGGHVEAKGRMRVLFLGQTSRTTRGAWPGRTCRPPQGIESRNPNKNRSGISVLKRETNSADSSTKVPIPSIGIEGAR
jgi:hypothetical protein